jgi:hypothetical protein
MSPGWLYSGRDIPPLQATGGMVSYFEFSELLFLSFFLSRFSAFFSFIVLAGSFFTVFLVS